MFITNLFLSVCFGLLSIDYVSEEKNLNLEEKKERKKGTENLTHFHLKKILIQGPIFWQ